MSERDEQEFVLEDLWTGGQVAVFLGVSGQYVYELRRDRKLEPVAVQWHGKSPRYFYDPEEVKSWDDRRTASRIVRYDRSGSDDV